MRHALTESLANRMGHVLLFLIASAFGGTLFGQEPKAKVDAPTKVTPPPFIYIPPPYTPPPPRRQTPFPVWAFTWVWLIPMLIIIQRQHKQRREEEENKTPYTEEDLMADWEFKILRDPLNRLLRQDFRERILKEESQAGWQLVELFDAGRVRLKRHPGQPAPSGQPANGVDPYRGVLKAPKGYMLCILFGILLAIVAGMLAVFTLVQALSNDPGPSGLAMMLGIGTLVSSGLAIFSFLRARALTRS